MFSFVDQVLSIEGGCIHGRFSVPENFGGAPRWMLVEAIGQLAGWLAMANSDFVSRPVGATVGALDLDADCRFPQGILRLAATIERTDRRAILYRGEVSSGGRAVASMRRCIGPLLPIEQFEDPQETRKRFRSLRGDTALALWSADIPLPRSEPANAHLNDDGSAVATFQIADDAALFTDHFPRKPVVPASLLIDAMCRLGAIAAHGHTEPANGAGSFTRVRRVKVRHFTKPGEIVQITTTAPQPAAAEDGKTRDDREVSVTAHNGETTVASVTISGFLPCAS